MEYYRSLVFAALVIVASGFSLTESTAGVRVPASWYIQSEDEFSVSGQLQEGGDGLESPGPELSRAVDSIYRTTLQSLNSLKLKEQLSTPKDAPRDWVPWHLDSFETDLAINAQGLLGVLTVRGTPAVVAIWRKPQRGLSPEVRPQEQTPRDSTLTVDLNEDMTDDQLWQQLRPIYSAIVASGKVTDGAALKANLLQSLASWSEVAKQVATDSVGQWWLSGFRCDFEVSATGTVLPAFLAVGGAVKFRMDWRRLQRTQRSGVALVSRKVSQKAQLLSGSQVSQLKQMALIIEQSLGSATEASLGAMGSFAPFSYRVGLGVGVNGEFGVARGSAALFGHLYFARDPSAPPGPKVLANFGSNPQLLLIGNPSIGSPLIGKLARSKSQRQILGVVPQKQSSGVRSRVPQDRFTAGLARAMKMAAFFARSDRAQGTEDGSWPLYEIRGAFDLSITGSLGLTGVSGFASSMVYLRRKPQI